MHSLNSLNSSFFYTKRGRVFTIIVAMNVHEKPDRVHKLEVESSKVRISDKKRPKLRYSTLASQVRMRKMTFFSG